MKKNKLGAIIFSSALTLSLATCSTYLTMNQAAYAESPVAIDPTTGDILKDSVKIGEAESGEILVYGGLYFKPVIEASNSTLAGLELCGLDYLPGDGTTGTVEIKETLGNTIKSFYGSTSAPASFVFDEFSTAFSVESSNIVVGSETKIIRIADNFIRNPRDQRVLGISGATNLEYIGHQPVGAGQLFAVDGSGKLALPASLKTVGANAFSDTSIITIDASACKDGLTFASGNVVDGASEVYGSMQGNKTLEKIILPATPDGTAKFDFGDYACAGCSKLASIVDNASPSTAATSKITSVGQYAFAGTGLTSFTAGAGLKMINVGAFSGCTSLDTVDLSGSSSDLAKTMSDKLFYGCSALKKVVFMNGCTKIGDHTFAGCSSLTTLDKVFVATGSVNNTITTIGYYAFSGCSALKLSPIAFESVTEIGDFAFQNCTSLTGGDTFKINLNATYGVGVFDGCSHITSFVIPVSGVPATFNAGLFTNCPQLVITLDDGVEDFTLGEDDNNIYSNGGKTLFYVNPVDKEGSAKTDYIYDLSKNTTVTDLGVACFCNSGVTKLILGAAQNGNGVANFRFLVGSGITHLDASASPVGPDKDDLHFGDVTPLESRETAETYALAALYNLKECVLPTAQKKYTYNSYLLEPYFDALVFPKGTTKIEIDELFMDLDADNFEPNELFYNEKIVIPTEVKTASKSAAANSLVICGYKNYVLLPEAVRSSVNLVDSEGVIFYSVDDSDNTAKIVGMTKKPRNLAHLPCILHANAIPDYEITGFDLTTPTGDPTLAGKIKLVAAKETVAPLAKKVILTRSTQELVYNDDAELVNFEGEKKDKPKQSDLEILTCDDYSGDKFSFTLKLSDPDFTDIQDYRVTANNSILTATHNQDNTYTYEVELNEALTLINIECPYNASGSGVFINSDDALYVFNTEWRTAQN